MIGSVMIFDVIAGSLLLICAINGLMRGAVHEMVRVTAFLVSAIAAVYALRFTAPVARRMMDPDWLAIGVALLAVFAVLYIAIRVMGASLTRRMEAHAALNVFDRTVGMGFGLIRAFVVLGMFNLLFHAATPPGGGPAWVTRAALFPLTETSGKVLKVFAPHAEEMGAAITSAVRQGATSDPDGGYSDGERRQLDDLVETTR